MWTAPQSFIQGSTVAFLFAAVKFTNEDIVCSEDFIFAISAKPVLKQQTNKQKPSKLRMWYDYRSRGRWISESSRPASYKV